jgi:hypothetical protein
MNQPKDKFGEVKKCPACGIIVGSYAVVCHGCGTEFREIPVSQTVEKFYARLSEVEADKKEEFITNFIVPNTKEEILDFLTMASSQIEPLSHFEYLFKTKRSQIVRRNTIWLRKMEQIQLRASISMKEDRAGFQIVSDIVSQAKTIIATNQKIANQAIISLLGVIVFVFSLLISMNY